MTVRSLPHATLADPTMHGLTGLLESAAVLVLAAYGLLMLCARAGVPGSVGYILAGVLIGPAGIGLVAESDGLAIIGEVGVILLLFALGLEFSFEKLASLRRHVFGTGAAQVAMTSVLIALPAAFVLDLAPVPAILLGGAVDMSSMAMCLKVLAGANALGSPAGRMAISVLLFQDLAAVGREEAQVKRRAGMILGHGAEFGLMLVSVSLSSGLISDMVAGPVLLAIGISMPIGSILVRWAARSGAGVD